MQVLKKNIELYFTSESKKYFEKGLKNYQIVGKKLKIKDSLSLK